MIEWNKNLLECLSHVAQWMSHSYGELFYDVTKYSTIAYLTLQNDSHTPCNMVSSICNAMQAFGKPLPG